MNREPFDESLLTAYLDDELSPGDRNKVESALRESPQLTKLLDELRTVRKLVTSAVRSEENKRASAEATTLADAGRPSFTIKGPWQSAAGARPTDTSPAMVTTKRVDPVVAATHDQAFRPAVRGWMMLASLAATVILGLFVFSPWRSKREVPFAAAPSLKGSKEAVEQPLPPLASAAPGPINAEKVPSARTAVAPPADVTPGMPVPSDPAVSYSESYGLSSAPKDASLSKNLGAASDALLNLLADASSRTDGNRGEVDAMARSPQQKELVSPSKKQSLDIDKSSPPNEGITEEPPFANRFADTAHFVFVLNLRVDSVPFADAKGSVAAAAAATGVAPGSVLDAPGVPPSEAFNAPGGSFGGTAGAGPSAAGGRADSRSLGRSTGGLASGRGADESTNALEDTEETGSPSNELEPGLSQSRKRKANALNHGEPSNRSWALAALDRAESSQGPSSQLVIEFRFPKDREEQAIVALRELGIVLPAGIPASDQTTQWFVSEIDDSKKSLYERVESRFVDRNKTDRVESEALSVPQRRKSELEPNQDQWLSIRILLRRRVAAPE